MKKITIISILSLIFWILSSLSTILISQYNDLHEIKTLIIGFVILGINRLLFFIFEDFEISKYISILINSIAMGFCLDAWFIYKEIEPVFTQMLITSIICMSFMILFYLSLNIKLLERKFNIYIIVFLIISGLTFVLLALTSNSTFTSTLGYYGILSLAFLFVLCVDSVNYEELLKNFTLSTFSGLIVGVIVLLGILEVDGDVDLGGASSGTDPKLVSPKNADVSTLKRRNEWKDL